MARVLVSYVGSNDPYGREDPGTGEPTAGPILSILDHLQDQGKLPQRVILLVTETHEREFPLQAGGKARHRQEGMEGQAEGLREAIAQRYSAPIQVEEIPLRVNPADLDEVIKATLEGLRGRLDPQDEVHVNVSSGTQAMSAAIVFLADSGHILHHYVWQSLDPTKLPPGAIRIKPVNLAYLSEGDRLNRALNLLRAMAFDHAEGAFKEITENTLIPERRPKAEAAARLMRAYRLWDLADFEGALDTFKGIEGLLRSSSESGSESESGRGEELLEGWAHLPYLRDQEELLEQLAEDCRTGRETRALLEDMYAGIERRRRSGHLINIPTRARRLYEGLMNFLLHEAGVVLEELEELRDKVQAVEGLAEQGSLRPLGLDGSEQGAKLKRLKALYSEFREVRNKSYEEHGLGKVSETEADLTIEAAREMMELVFPGSAGQLEGHPFGVKAIDEVARGLQEWFGA